MSDPNPSNTVVISDGAVEYSLDETAVPIADVIEALKQAEDDGYEYVVALSGNRRGPKFVRTETDVLEPVEDVL